MPLCSQAVGPQAAASRCSWGRSWSVSSRVPSVGAGRKSLLYRAGWTLLCLCQGVGLKDLDVTEGGGERLKGRELVGIDLCHAA
jgi:hypothetical protein